MAQTLRQAVGRVLPRRHIECTRASVARLRHRGSARTCPVCDARLARFLPVGKREEAECPVCGARERHRALWPLLLERLSAASGPTRLLHFAPERCFEPRLRRLPQLDYITTDLAGPGAMVRGDITRMGFRDGSFDQIICNHVLEHIRADAAAMAELHRLLRPGSEAWITVPGSPPARPETEESPANASPEELFARFGHRTHVRLYGRDVEARLRAAGFEVDLVLLGHELTPAERERRAQPSEYPLYRCRRPA
jgi:hypothetical protein